MKNYGLVLRGEVTDVRTWPPKDGKKGFAITSIFDGKKVIDVLSPAPLGQVEAVVEVPVDANLRSRPVNGQIQYEVAYQARGSAANPANSTTPPPLTVGAR